MANIIVLGIYITKVCLSLASILPIFLIEAAVGATATIAGALVLLFGSYFIYRGKGIKGGMLNIVAGGIMVFLYGYYTGRWKFPLLVQLGLPGLLLLVPAPISGILGILISKLER